MVAEWDAENAIRWAYLANVVVYRCVQVIASSLAGCPFRVGADPDKPMDFDPNAKMARLLGPPPYGPAPNISARMLWANAVAQWIVTGRFAWEIELGDRTGEPIALWPLVSSKLRAVPSAGGTEFFKEFEYGRPQDQRRLPPERVFYAWNPSLNDWRQPESELQSARLDISVAVMQDRYDYAFLKNDARPAALIVTEAFDSDESARAFKDQFLSEHQGPDQAGRMAFVEAQDTEGGQGVTQAIDIKQLGLSQRDGEFIKRYESKIRNMAIALGVPFSILDASGRTFSNAGAEWQTFWTVRMMPLMADFQDRVNMALAPRFGDGRVGWFDLSKVKALQEEKKHQPVGVHVLVQSQIAKINEGREMVGLPAETGLDRFMTSEEITALKNQSAMAERSKPKPELDTKEPTKRAGLIMPFIDHEVRRTKAWKSFDAQAKTLEKSWARSMRQLFKRQLASTLARLEGKRGRQLISEKRSLDPKVVFDVGFWEDETEEIVLSLYEAVFAAGGARVAGQFGLAFDLEAPYVQDFIKQRANKLAGEVTETTFSNIKDQLAEGIGQGESVPDLSARIRDVFSKADKLRATTIARTEVISTYNGSAQVVSEQLGPDIVAGQEWIASLDDRIRDEHAEANGQVVSVRAPFIVGGEELLYPGDPAGSGGNVINCRCTIALLTPEEISERKKARVPVRTVEKLFARVATNGLTAEQAIQELVSA